MPQRSNLFQETVAAVQAHLAGDATVTESAKLKDKDTGSDREVDVLVTATVAGTPIAIGIEARDSVRRADVTWVEQILQKHSRLPTNKVVLVSDSGFTADAQTKAEAADALCVSPELLPGGDPTYRVANHLNTLFAKYTDLQPNYVRLEVRDLLGGELQVIEDPPRLLDIVTTEGELVCSLDECVTGIVNQHMNQHMDSEEMRNRDKPGTGTFEMTVAPLTAMLDGVDRPLCVLGKTAEGEQFVCTIERIEIKGAAALGIAQFDLEHRSIAGVTASSGTFEHSGRPVTVIATAQGDDERIVVRVQDSPQGPSRVVSSGPPRPADVTPGEE